MNVFIAGGGAAADHDTPPLHLDAPPAMRPRVDSIATLEAKTLGAPNLIGTVLRYGAFHGADTNFDPQGRLPLGAA